MHIILKQIGIFKSPPAMTEWLTPHEKSTIVKIWQRPECTTNRKKTCYPTSYLFIYPVSTRGLAQFTPLATSNCSSSGQSVFLCAGFSLFSAPWKPQGCHGSCYQEGSEKMLTTPCFFSLTRCKALCPLCLHRHYAPLCNK